MPWFFVCLCVFLLVFLLFKVAPKRSAEVLASVPKRKKVVMYFTEKIHVFDKCPSGMCYIAVGCEFSVNERTICIK